VRSQWCTDMTSQAITSVECCFVAVCVLCQALCATTCWTVIKQHSTLSSRYHRATLCVNVVFAVDRCMSVRPSVYVWHVLVLVLYPERGLQGPNSSCRLCPSNERKVSARVATHDSWYRSSVVALLSMICALMSVILLMYTVAVCHVRVLYPKDWRYRQTSFTTR